MRLQRSLITIKAYLTICVLATLIILSSARVLVAMENPESKTADGSDNILDSVVHEQMGTPYFHKLQEWKDQNIENGTEEYIIDGTDYFDKSDLAEVVTRNYQGRENVLIFQSQREGWIEYQFKVDQAGMYELWIDYRGYHSDTSRMSSYQSYNLGVMINGEYPYREARSIRLPRFFKDEWPLQKDAYGDQIRPRPIEIERWQSLAITDLHDSYDGPLKWHFREGSNTIRLQLQQAIAIDQLRLAKPSGNPVTYEDYLQQFEDIPSPQGIEPIVIQAERMTEKNEVSIQILSDKDAFMVPQADGKRIFNAVGSGRWADGGFKITWDFNVPEEGMYKIALRNMNNWFSNKTVFRRLYLNGEIPFQEVSAFGIPYSNQWQKTVFADENQTPYLFYFDKGNNSISMSVTYAPLKEVQILLEHTNLNLSALLRDMQFIVRGDDDPLRTWDIVNEFPDLLEQLQSIRSQIETMAEKWVEINGSKDDQYQSLRTSIADIDEILLQPNELPNKRDTLSMIQQKVGSLSHVIFKQPLSLDEIYIIPAEEDFPRMTANLWEKSWNGFKNFIRSFQTDNSLSANEDEVLNVWMFYGRDYVNLLQELADQYFTPETGIPVKVDLLPREELLVLSNATGNTPDVVLGVGEGRPSEFAFRDAAVELSKFEGFDELMEYFAPGSMLPYYYNEGYYAIPETLQLKMLFYRKDILDELELAIPETWDDVHNMMPTLQQQGYNFFLSPTEFLPFIYQNGADFYGEDGLNSGFDTPEGFAAFRQMTDLFNIYGIDQQVPSFYQHFRVGYMPIGIADLNTYLELKVAAPELTGWWGMAPIPGITNDDGVIERWSGGNIGMLGQGLGGTATNRAASGTGSQTASMIMKKSQNQEWGWEFIKWWLSPMIQEQFGMELEGFYGEEFRWNTANIEAFTRLPWSQEELQQILESWKWYKAMVNVPGSYLIPRELNNAWNRTVVDGMNYRESLENAIMNIDQEFVRKQKEFGYRDEQGQPIQSFNLPVVDSPWKGVDPY